MVTPLRMGSAVSDCMCDIRSIWPVGITSSRIGHLIVNIRLSSDDYIVANGDVNNEDLLLTSDDYIVANGDATVDNECA